ncbi:alpha/beta fold hydrolase [Microlunatus speluncae]|uniref:alpha/beta fold hydrolase n=1 Tax=Microlunatus speluncae TaxID=2594267 RepID=UPI001C2D69B1|nr:alpha/beta fold hydrolase [Microlunatus speluncae]
MSTPTSSWSPPLPEASGFDHDVIETPGLRTHVAAIGAGEPVVLLHGFPEHWWQWHAVAPVIAAAGYRAICPDLRGPAGPWPTTRGSSARPGSAT